MGGLKQDYWQNYVDGNWVDGGAGRLTVENPGIGEPLAEIALVNAADIDRAAKAALACHESGGVETPFGGYGKSGYGRETGREALWNYVQTNNTAYRTR